MGEKIQFPSNGHTCEGYLARPAGGKGPAVVVIQEWWGLVPHIQDLCDRFAAEGLVAIAPDLYHGQTATSPNDAAKLLMELDFFSSTVGRTRASPQNRDGNSKRS